VLTILLDIEKHKNSDEHPTLLFKSDHFSCVPKRILRRPLVIFAKKIVISTQKHSYLLVFFAPAAARASREIK
jgi:hypothetical protein